MDLSINIGGVRFKNPIMAGAGPETRNLTNVKLGVDAGCGALVIRSLHLKELSDKRAGAHREFWHVYQSPQGFKKGHSYGFQSTGCPSARVTPLDPGFGGGSERPTLKEYTKIVADMVEYAHAQDCRIIASIGLCGHRRPPDECWAAEAEAMARAGVDGIEVHTSPSPSTEGPRFIQLDPQKYLIDPIQIAKRESGLPVWAKVGMDGCDTIAACKIAEEAGAAAVVPVTRWASMNIDLDNPFEKTWGLPGYGGPWSAPIMTALIYRMLHPTPPLAGNIGIPIVASGGIFDGDDILRYVLAGALGMQVCSQFLLEGYGIVAPMLKRMEAWMEQHGFARLEDFRGKVQIVGSDPSQRSGMDEFEPTVDDDSCIGCGLCVDACWNQAIQVSGTAQIDKVRCQGCRNCHYVCPSKAISIRRLKKAN
ncbi:MAG: 4Fe-4S binding protein [Clostridiales Family XIII bacterium]|jgi:dihydroorotate dehydrogenase (fumarate)/dihydropyrimidine dehydrogenase (NAD+) subunit PreA|nr:4Fe-4S binding protein [Clostridiales Family XIII bacterium]